MDTPESATPLLQPSSTPTDATTDATDIPRWRTIRAFLCKGTCSRTLMSVLDRELEHPLPAEEAATTPHAGGLMQGYQCGMLWGSSLAAGAEAQRQHGPGNRAEALAVETTRQLVAAFRQRNQHINCMEITETDPRDGWQVFVHFFVKGGTFKCMGRAASFAPDALRVIKSARVEAPAAQPGSCQPASCAALLARRMGATEEQAATVAGLAEGLGLSGGACGALGAAIWLVGLQGSQQGAASKQIRKRIERLTEQFLELSEYQMECAEITGRAFESAADHAEFLARGGCGPLIEQLAAAASTPPHSSLPRDPAGGATGCSSSHHRGRP